MNWNSAWLPVLAVLAISSAGSAAEPKPNRPNRIIRIAVAAIDPYELRIAEVLKKRIQKRSNVGFEVVKTFPQYAYPTLQIWLFRKDASPNLKDGDSRDRLSTLDMGPEGYTLRVATRGGGGAVWIWSTDKRGMLYAIGELLRRMTYHEDAIEITSGEFRSAPAYRWRGSSANQGGTMRQITGARGWTENELHDVILDYALAGANTFYAGGSLVDFVKSFDLMTEFGCRPNQLGKPRPEWRKRETDGGPYVCPSIPEARAALLEYWDERFKEAPDAEVLRFFSGDPGGCRCPDCAPWGGTFVHLSEELTAIWKKYHPSGEVQICNQDLDNAGDEAIFQYLNKTPRTWLNSVSYGPGSNPLSRYFRSELREDLFVYPREGAVSRWLAELLHRLPKEQTIVHYSDITHWISSQYQVEKPEPHLMAIYGRRTFHQRPRAFYKIFHQIMPFSEGDIIYSEGHHDELHQYLWNRMLWDPNRELEDLLMEYATHHFSPAAAPEMIEAILQLEENLESPLETNDGIERYYQLVKSAGSKIPENLMRIDYRWREHMQKAALDRYFQLKLRREKERTAQVLGNLSTALETKDPASWVPESISAAHSMMSEPIETAEMNALREAAMRVGEESDRTFGVRNTGSANLEMHLTDMGWLSRQIDEAMKLTDSSRQRALIHQLVHYEDAGEGGYYDDAGGPPERQPHLVIGESLGNPGFIRNLLDPNNRPSANRFAYNQGGPVVFRYSDLDPAAQYKLKVTLVAPRYPAAMNPDATSGVPPRRSEDIRADGFILAKDLELPIYTARQFEFEIPHEATGDGALDLSFQRVDSPGARGAIVSEVWLMKR